MLELIKFHFGIFQFYKGMLSVSPWIAGMKAKMVSHQLAKEKLLSHFFKGIPEIDFIKICNDFTKEKLPGLIRKSALQKIEQYQKNNVPVVVVTASAENWVKIWCDSINAVCIASKLEVIDGRLTGKLEGKNCNYEEKVQRIKVKYNLENFNNIFCYGDSAGDRAMLEIATEGFYRSLV